MEASQALDQLRSRLEGSFGRALAMMILMTCCNSTGVSMMGIGSQVMRIASAPAWQRPW